MNNFDHVEKFVGHEIPKCIKVILLACGYDSLLSLKQITSERIDEMEHYIEKKKEKIISKLDDGGDVDIVNEYKNQNQFKFLPGHRSIILDIANDIKDMQVQQESQSKHLANVIEENSDEQIEYSVILSQLIETAERNKNKSKYANCYTDTIKYFSTYIFLLCGRTCYETLYRNLPIPSTKTICKYIYLKEILF